ncbi:TetR/AcrR family transcriptional regulator [Paraconexibacter algicola]|uniref:TetR/AcrR family transcriptional regulator n=1 Tax=Paraconexibacter algicola TaxID=2133960 RepID=A0A2T4UH74_9ACTN|nr:TetR/AcrR family transcriptional regulator [Paraconexibacter algicola]PTL58567.1 TetR/AcrR family transcriptional regulator [Paraconexibacter algicola]
MLPDPIAALLATAAEPLDATADRILDAAVLEAAAVGLQRMRVEDVVRRSGLGRMTVYRRFARRDDLVRALVARETQRFLAATAAAIEAAPRPEEEGVEAFLAGVRFSRTHPMLRRLAETGPGAAMDALAADDGAMLRMGAGFIAQRMLAGSPDASPREVGWVADLLARLYVTYVAVPPTDPDPADEDQLRAYARTVLVPLVEGVVRPRPR